MNAEQYRTLVAKLEAINPSQLNELKIGDINPATGKRVVSGATDGSGNLIASGTPGVYWNAKEEPVEAPASTPVPAEEPIQMTPRPPVNINIDQEPASAPTPAPVEPCGPEVKEKIKAQKTFNAAYGMAKQAGCPDFDWCQIVNVPVAQGGMSATASNPAPVTTNPMGDYDPTSFNGQAAAYNEDIEESVYVAGSTELDRVREIAGTQIVSEAGGIPEIKASSKAAAIAIAQQKGIKQFRFCGKYKVQAVKKPQQAQSNKLPIAPQQGGMGSIKKVPAPAQKVDYTGQATPLGGDAQNPMSFAANSNFGA